MPSCSSMDCRNSHPSNSSPVLISLSRSCLHRLCVIQKLLNRFPPLLIAMKKAGDSFSRIRCTLCESILEKFRYRFSHHQDRQSPHRLDQRPQDQDGLMQSCSDSEKRYQLISLRNGRDAGHSLPGYSCCNS
jgi:hypothetical protein